MYILYKIGQYGHGVYGVFAELETAKSNCKLAAVNDKDAWHTYQVYFIQPEKLFIGEPLDDGFMETQPIFSCKKADTIRPTAVIVVDTK